MPFPYKTVLVTGATSGIGQALVERMLTNDDSDCKDIFVIAAGRRQDRLDALLAAYGPDKIAIETFDAADLAGLPAWVAKVTAAYPKLDCVVFNAGFQQSLDFAAEAPLPLDDVTSEMIVNYLSPVHATALFLPHLKALAPAPAAVMLVSSGLALVPITRCPNYCASKAALHSFAWTLRSQLAGAASSSHLRVVEIIPPAVQTELHTRQGQSAVGMPLAAFIDETWAGLTAAEPLDEVLPKSLQTQTAGVEDKKLEAYRKFEALTKGVTGQK